MKLRTLTPALSRSERERESKGHVGFSSVISREVEFFMSLGLRARPKLRLLLWEKVGMRAEKTVSKDRRRN